MTETKPSADATATETTSLVTPEAPKTRRASLTGRGKKAPETASAATKPTPDATATETTIVVDSPFSIAEASIPAGEVVSKRWKCSLPADKLIPASIVEGDQPVNKARAAELYKQQQGIYSTPHEVNCEPID